MTPVPHVVALSVPAVIGELRCAFLAALNAVRHDLRPRVLIADDNDGYARLLAEALHRREIACDIAHDEGGVRLLLARQGGYALLVLDGAWEPGGDEKTPILYVTGRDLSDCHPRPVAGFRSKADGIEAIAEEIRGLVR